MSEQHTYTMKQAVQYEYFLPLKPRQKLINKGRIIGLTYEGLIKRLSVGDVGKLAWLSARFGQPAYLVLVDSSTDTETNLSILEHREGFIDVVLESELKPIG